MSFVGAKPPRPPRSHASHLVSAFHVGGDPPPPPMFLPAHPPFLLRPLATAYRKTCPCGKQPPIRPFSESFGGLCTKDATPRPSLAHPTFVHERGICMEVLWGAPASRSFLAAASRGEDAEERNALLVRGVCLAGRRSPE